MSLLKKLSKSGSIKPEILSSSVLFKEKDMTVTDVPMLNVAFSGKLDGGFTSGLTVFAGPSRHFKTLFGLIAMKAYLQKHKDAIALFYDSEFGTPEGYFESLGIDTERILHIPIKNIEELTHDCVQKLDDIERGEKVFVFIDSVGNLASKKEAQDALDGKSVADMTRAKQLKSFFRIVTPHLTLKDLPMLVINHSYQTMEMFSKSVMSGGTGILYSANNAYIIGRQQEKSGKELDGYNFVINVEKSRFVREKSKIPITVTFEKGLSKWSGLLDVALELGYVVKPKLGWYSVATTNPVTGEVLFENKEFKNYRKEATNTKEFWEPIFNETDFKDAISRRYLVSTNKMMTDEDDVSAELESLEINNDE